MIKRIFTAFLIPCLGLLTACQQSGSDHNGESNTDLTHIETYPAPQQTSLSYEAGSGPGLELNRQHHNYALKQLSSKGDENNHLDSPYSQQIFIAGISLGAKDTSLSALETGIDLNLSDIQAHQSLSAWQQHINSLTPITSNYHLWGQQSYPFSKKYLEAQSILYHPQLTGIDFASNPALASETINNSFSNPTSIVDSDSRSRLVATLENNISSSWSATLTVANTTGSFAILNKDEQRSVEMVKVDGLINTTQHTDYQAVEVPLNDESLSMIMIIPKENRFGMVKESIDETFLTSLLQSLSLQNGSVMIPHFIINQPTWDINIGVAGSENDANFYNVNNQGDLYLLKPQRNISFTVDEKGITSCDALSIIHRATDDEQWTPQPVSGGIVITGPGKNYQSCYYPPDQRPFLFIIYEKESKTLLHTGQITTLPGELIPEDWRVSLFETCGDNPPSY